MDRKKLILITGAVIITGVTFVLGFSYGFRAGEQQVVVEPQVEVNRQVTVLELLESPMIHSLMTNISGEVTEITDRILTVTENDETISVPIKQHARIVLFGYPDQFTDMEIENIEVNNRVDIVVDIKSDGQLEGTQVIVGRNE